MKTFVNKINISYSITGKGPPVLLLHGYPQTKLMWRKIIPSLSKYFTVVTSDLRGYGDSDKPVADKKHLNYSKRQMAKDQVMLMKKLGFNNFFCVGHDRGARVFHRAGVPKNYRDNMQIILVTVPKKFSDKLCNINDEKLFEKQWNTDDRLVLGGNYYVASTPEL